MPLQLGPIFHVHNAYRLACKSVYALCGTVWPNPWHVWTVQYMEGGLWKLTGLQEKGIRHMEQCGAHWHRGFVGISCPIYKELCASYEMIWFRALNFSLSNPVSLFLFPEGAVLPGQELPSMTKAPSGFAMVFSVRIERGASLGKNSQASNLLQIYDLGQII